jgi:hypothetical protein
MPQQASYQGSGQIGYCVNTTIETSFSKHVTVYTTLGTVSSRYMTPELCSVSRQRDVESLQHKHTRLYPR